MGDELDQERLEHILAAICDRLGGQWLLIGGALVTVWVEPRRITEDVDIMGLEGSPRERLALLHLADELGIPIETLNSAADFFVRRIPDWREQLEVLRTGSHGTIYRPTATLFVLLKMRRLTETDLQDCIAVIDRARASGESLDTTRLREALDGLEPDENGSERAARRRRLRETIDD